MHTGLSAAMALLAALVSALGSVMRQQATSPDGRISRTWYVGAAIALSSFVFQVAALALGPVLLVQPLLVLSVLFGLLIQSAWTRIAPTPRQWLLGAAVAGGVAMFVFFARPVPAIHGRQQWVLDLVVGVLLAALLAAVLLARHSTGNRAGLLYGTVAGALFGLVAVQIKSVTEQLHDPLRALTSVTTYLCAATIAVAVWCQQRAFARGSLDAAYPAMVVTEPIVAMVVSLAILGEKLSAHSLSTAVSIIGAGVMVIGVLGLARGAAVRIEETRPGLPRAARR